MEGEGSGMDREERKGGRVKGKER
uniref:Uncharacterized protein n=1 Tax=Anguilla anguilla TaxID=7936 RepID=A0A0E9UKC8_ANGAN